MEYKADITIIGAGVVGLAIAAEIANENRRVFILEKNDSFGCETSSHNSQVIHSGIYYQDESLKAKTCVEGKTILYELCRRCNIEYRQVGKLIVAVDNNEIDRLEMLRDKGRKNGVNDLRILTRQEVRRMEPNVTAVAALFSPSTGIIDAYSLMKYYIAQTIEKGASIGYRAKVVGIKKENGGYTVFVEDNGKYFEFNTKIVVNSAGLNSDKIAEMAGINAIESGYRLLFCKGEYFRVNRDSDKLVERLIYPVPESGGAGLGIHTTPTLDGTMLLGPSIHYVDSVDYSVDEQLKMSFYESVVRFLPFLNYNELEPEMAGIRPTLQGPDDGFRDFVIRDERDKGLPGFINLIGIESPGLTSSPAIARHVEKLVNEALINQH